MYYVKFTFSNWLILLISDWLIGSCFYWFILDDHFCPACAYSSSSDDQLIAQLEFYFSQGRFSNISISTDWFRIRQGFISDHFFEIKPLKDNLIQDHYLRSQMDDEVSKVGCVSPLTESLNETGYIASFIHNRGNRFSVAVSFIIVIAF